MAPALTRLWQRSCPLRKRKWQATVPPAVAVPDATRAHAEKVIIGGKKLSDDPIFRRRLTEFEMDQACARFTNNRIRESISKGIAPGPEAAFMKLYSTELGKKINDTMMGVMGPESQVFIDKDNSGDELEVSRIFLFAHASTIAAGSSEILRNIISKRILGLPGN